MYRKQILSTIAYICTYVYSSTYVYNSTQYMQRMYIAAGTKIYQKKEVQPEVSPYIKLLLSTLYFSYLKNWKRNSKRIM